MDAPAERQAAYKDAIAAAEAVAAEETAKRDELRTRAEAAQHTYDALNYRDDQFDLADTLIALAISLLALTALTHKAWLYWAAMVAVAGGVAMGLAGLMNLPLHPDALARLLS